MKNSVFYEKTNLVKFVVHRYLERLFKNFCVTKKEIIKKNSSQCRNWIRLKKAPRITNIRGT